MLHGLENAKKAMQTAKQIFENKSTTDDMPKLTLNEKEFQNEIHISDLIVKMNLASSKSESRKLIRGHGVKLNGEIVDNELQTLNFSQISDSKIVISVGKKKHFQVIIE